MEELAVTTPAWACDEEQGLRRAFSIDAPSELLAQQLPCGPLVRVGFELRREPTQSASWAWRMSLMSTGANAWRRSKHCAVNLQQVPHGFEGWGDVSASLMPHALEVVVASEVFEQLDGKLVENALDLVHDVGPVVPSLQHGFAHSSEARGRKASRFQINELLDRLLFGVDQPVVRDHGRKVRALDKVAAGMMPN
jgi:hypothetical protein